SRSVLIHLQRCDEGFLRDVDLAELAHLPLALLLLVEELALAGDVAAIAFGGHVLAERADRLACDHLAADSGLDWYLEQVPRDQVLELLAHRPAARLGALLVDDHGERIHRLAVDEDRELHEVAL